MPPQRALIVTQIVYTSIYVPIEGTDPIEYVESYEPVQVAATLDMNNFNSISRPYDDYGQPTSGCNILLNNGEIIFVSNSYEDVNSYYTTYLNGG
jgi:hypothetical protein